MAQDIKTHELLLLRMAEDQRYVGPFMAGRESRVWTSADSITTTSLSCMLPAIEENGQETCRDAELQGNETDSSFTHCQL
jgi:hypothetical protein